MYIITKNNNKNFYKGTNMKKITQSAIIHEVSKKTNVQASTVQDVFSSFIDIVKETLKENDTKVFLKGIGTLENVATLERIARDLHTGKPLRVSASRKVKFKQSTVLKKYFKEKVAVKKPTKKVSGTSSKKAAK